METFIGRSIAVEEQDFFAVFEFSEMLLVCRPHDHFEVAGNVWRIIRSFDSARVTNFVGNVEVPLDVADVERDWVVEDEESFNDENVEQVVVPDYLVQIAVILVAHEQLFSVDFQLMLVLHEIVLEQVFVLRTRSMSGSRVVEKKLVSENHHNVVDHLFHVDRAQHFPIEVSQLLNEDVVGIVDISKVCVLVQHFNSIYLEASFQLVSAQFLEMFVE